MKNKAEEIFKKHGGQLTMSEAVKYGISRTKLYSMRDNGILEQISRGVYRLSELPFMTHPDLVIIGKRFSNAVICLISALSYHRLTTQIPHEVYIAISRQSNFPKLVFPAISAHRFSDSSFGTGLEEHIIDGVSVKIYCPEKTLADCFKFRNKIGMDVVMEAFKMYRENQKMNISLLLKYAKVCRVESIMKPYLEAAL